MPTCPNCGNQAAENAVFCDQCGTRLPAPEPGPQPEAAVESVAGSVPEDVQICPDCGAQNVPGELFCDVCGNPLEAPMPISEPTPEAAVAEPVVEAPVEAEAVVEQTVEAEPAAAPAPAQETYCPTCGAPIQPGDTFCGNCGAAIGTPPPEAEVAPIEPILDEEAAVELPAPDGAVEAAPVEGWVPEEVVIEEVVVEEVQPEETPAQVAAETVVEPEVVEPKVAGPKAVPPEPVPAPEAAPPPETAPAVETTARPYLEVVDSGAHIPLVEQPTLLIGRVDQVSGIYPDVDLTPHGGEEGGVSRRHAELRYVAGAWSVVDLDSTNGTLLNGTGLQPKVPVPLSDGDRLALGELELVFRV